MYKPPPQPDGFPDGDEKRVLFDADGKPINLRERANGAIIEVCLDHDKGTLLFGINGGPLQRALGGFPVGAAMRPCAFLPFKDDAVRSTRSSTSTAAIRRVARREADAAAARKATAACNRTNKSRR